MTSSFGRRQLSLFTAQADIHLHHGPYHGRGVGVASSPRSCVVIKLATRAGTSSTLATSSSNLADSSSCALSTSSNCKQQRKSEARALAARNFPTGGGALSESSLSSPRRPSGWSPAARRTVRRPRPLPRRQPPPPRYPSPVPSPRPAPAAAGAAAAPSCPVGQRQTACATQAPAAGGRRATRPSTPSNPRP